MMRVLCNNGQCIWARALFRLAIFLLPGCADAKSSISVLFTFNGSDGGNPEGGLIEDAGGNFYGTTFRGGTHNCGTVFKLAPDGSETVLYSFTGGSDGSQPTAGLIEDASGNFYGTTYEGGAYKNGTAFKLAPDGTETVLHAFTGGSDGGYVWAGLIMDSAGNLYGTTVDGGPEGGGGGTIFKLTPDGTETVLYTFCSETNCADGANPYSELVMDGGGNLYGTTKYGGNSNCSNGNGCGVVFELAQNGTETTLYSFTGASDGYGPSSGLIFDSSGNLYGTAFGSGPGGQVYKVAPDGTETVFYDFKGGSADGAAPYGGLITDGAGNFYGTTASGGRHEGGTVFKITPDGTETVLGSFIKKIGEYPFAGVISDQAGYLYGTLYIGDGRGCFRRKGCGTVFKVKE